MMHPIISCNDAVRSVLTRDQMDIYTVERKEHFFYVHVKFYLDLVLGTLKHLTIC